MEELLGELGEGRELPALLPIELPALLVMLRLGVEVPRDALLLEDLLREALLDFARVVFPLELRLALLALARAGRALARLALRDLLRAGLAFFALARARDFFAPPRAELDFFRLADERLRDDDDRALLPPLFFAIESPF